MSELSDYVKELYEKLDDETPWDDAIPLLRLLFEGALARLAECSAPPVPLKRWLRYVLFDLDRMGGEGVEEVLMALQEGSRAAYGDIRELIGDKTVIGSGPFARAIYDDTEARVVSSLGAFCYRLGRALKQ